MRVSTLIPFSPGDPGGVGPEGAVRSTEMPAQNTAVLGAGDSERLERRSCHQEQVSPAHSVWHFCGMLIESPITKGF